LQFLSMSTPTQIILLTLLLGIQPITTDLYLPALPGLTQALGSQTSQAQLTLSALLLAFGSSQLAWGPLSDRFGRRPILLLGLALYVAAAVAAALAPSMTALITARAFQGAAMGAAVMCARAIVRDLFEPAQGARMMSKGLTGLGLVAIFSPSLGGLAAQYAGWRAALGLTAVFGVLALAFVALRFKETLASPKLDALQPAPLLRAWGQIIRHPTFLAWAALQSASYCALFTFLAASSFVFLKVYGLSPGAYGLWMCTTSGMYVAGTFWCRWLLVRAGLRRSVRIAGCLTLLGGTGVGVFALLGWHTPLAFLLPFYVLMFAHGVHQPTSQSGALGPFPHMAGTAAALAGFIMMSMAFGVGHWLGWRLDGTVFALTQGVWFWSVVVALVALTLVQRHGEHHAPGAPDKA
jgi:MFS transporter, DHA1 family, multidrug resistance protein